MIANKPHIVVCICTFKRPHILKVLLKRIDKQITDNLFDISIVVVDNDFNETARSTIEDFTKFSQLKVMYSVEKEQNIALARNRAVGCLNADYYAFIDDDELPNSDWILGLYKAIIHYKAHGVLAPVLPLFLGKPPDWVYNSKLFNRPAHNNGYILPWNFTRTGNVLFLGNLFKENDDWFNPAFGSGGEDRDFFKRMIDRGYNFVWCNNYPVYEIIPKGRWNKKVLLKRSLLRGKMAAKTSSNIFLSICYSSLAGSIYLLSLPVLFFISFETFFRYLIKITDHFGKILGFIDCDLVKDKYIQG